MIVTHPSDGFENAAAFVLTDAPAPAGENGNGAAPGGPLTGEELERARRNKKATGQPRGRPASGARAAAGAPSSGNARPAASGPISDPEKPKPLPPPPPIDPARIEGMFRDVINPTLAKLGADPFTEKELRDGAKVIAPLWDDYAAKAAAQGTTRIDPVVAAFWMWFVPTAAPRALQASLAIYARIKARRQAKKGAGFDGETTADENARRAAAGAPAGGEAPAPADFRQGDGRPEPIGNIGRGQIPLRSPGLA